MDVSILLLELPDQPLAAVRAAFQQQVPAGWEVRAVPAAAELLAAVRDDSRRQIVVLPQALAGEDATVRRLIASLRSTAADVPIVVVAERGNVESAAQAIRAGANDFLVCGEQLAERVATLLGKLRGLLEALERNRRLGEDNAQLRRAIQAGGALVGQSPQVRELLEHIRRVAPVPRPVLIVGERGTGKELVARAIHLAAGAASRPIVTVNCAAFSDALLESELFGYDKGAFTGADAARPGKFEWADGGTLFLDEIGHMSLAFQEKILRVVEYGTFTRVGGSQEQQTTARIIAATNRDLAAMIHDGKFLADLHDRLTFETIRVPPLRCREGDVALLAQHFLEQFGAEVPALAGKRLSVAALDALQHYSFPGNVRELKNMIERAACRDTAGEITAADLGLPELVESAGGDGSFSARLHEYGRRLLDDALHRSGGNQAQAARDLRLSYHRFRYYLKKYGLR
jgi:DNA-binding NtrC family response regulator